MIPALHACMGARAQNISDPPKRFVTRSQNSRRLISYNPSIYILAIVEKKDQDNWNFCVSQQPILRRKSSFPNVYRYVFCYLNVLRVVVNAGPQRMIGPEMIFLDLM